MSTHERKFFDASTSHVTEAGRDWLNEVGHENAVGTQGHHTVASTSVGWFFWAGEGDETMPDDMAAMRFVGVHGGADA